MFAQSAIALVLWYGAYLVLSGEMKIGSLTSFLLYTLTLAMGFAFLSGLYGQFMSAVGASERIFALIDSKPKVNTKQTGVVPLDDFKGSVTFENVVFTYPTRPDSEVLKGIDLEIKPGSVVALVGPSGIFSLL